MRDDELYRRSEYRAFIDGKPIVPKMPPPHYEGHDLPPHTHSRYVGRGMPLYPSTGIRTCLCLFLMLAVCVRGNAQASDARTAKTDEDQFKDLLKQGFDLHRQTRFAEAIPVLERARSLEPQDYFANLLEGIDLLRTGKAREAIPRLELAARVKPEEETPENYLGEAQASLGRYADAAGAYRRAMLRGHNSEESLE